MVQTYDEVMRTTIDLPDDVHRAALLLARDRSQTLSRTVADLLRQALTHDDIEDEVELGAATGLPVLRLGRPLNAEDVARMSDDE